MKIWLSRIGALALVLALLPGALELLESAAHLAAEGHLAHASPDGDEHEPAGPEHGCTPTFHFCGCHASLSFLDPQRRPTMGLHASLFEAPRSPELLPPAFWPAIDRPPRA